jgi:hypothetical protein
MLIGNITCYCIPRWSLGTQTTIYKFIRRTFDSTGSLHTGSHHFWRHYCIQYCIAITMSDKTEHINLTVRLFNFLIFVWSNWIFVSNISTFAITRYGICNWDFPWVFFQWLTIQSDFVRRE